MKGIDSPPPNLSHFRNDPSRILSTTSRSADAWQANLLRGDSRQIMLLCSRQAGKSTVAAALAIKAALLSAPALILLLSPTQRQSGELFRDKVKRLYGDLGSPVKITQESALSLELANGSRILSLPGDEETIRGYSGVRLLVIDEAARVPDELYRAVRPMLAVSGGRLVALSTPFGKRGWFHAEWFGSGSWDRVRVPADQCPRIPAEFLADELRAMGKEWYDQEYMCIFNDATSTPLFPEDWLTRAEQIAARLPLKRQARAIGVDPGEGVSSTSMAAVDEYGLIELVSRKTLNTSQITSDALAFARRHNVPPERVIFDAGGGGRQHADRLAEQGFPVRTVGFGEAATALPQFGTTYADQRLDNRQHQYSYVNRRAEMYGALRILLDPANSRGFGLPACYTELRRQLAPMPLLYDGEGRMRMLPKNKRGQDSKEQTLVELIGCSPDDSDALVLAIFAMQNDPVRARAGVMR